MKKGILARTLSVMAALLLALPSAAQSYAADGGMPAFSRERFLHSGTWLPYRKAAFNIGEEKPAALILYLHGGTSRGDDNTAQLDEPAVSAISRHVSAHGLHAVLIVPQCPAGQFWAGAMSNVLTALVEDYAARDSIDASRLYVLGSSMGGTGTWSLLDNCPGLFAAAMPVAGNPSGHSARNVALTPSSLSWELPTISWTSTQCAGSSTVSSKPEERPDSTWNTTGHTSRHARKATLHPASTGCSAMRPARPLASPHAQTGKRLL